MLTDRQRKICAAGKPTAKDCIEGVKGLSQDYCLQDEVDALLHDALIPPPKPHTGRLRRPPPKDMRNAGTFSEGRDLINPPTKTKYLELVNDLKETTYASYWKKQTGSSRDSAPFLPEGYNRESVTFGKSTKSKETAHDVFFSVNPILDQELPPHVPGVQSNRNYCESAFDKNKTFGIKYQRSSSVESCLKYDTIYLGKHLSSAINERQAEFKRTNTPKLGLFLARNDNINNVSKGFRFGLQTIRTGETAANCFKYCEINPEKALLYDCLEHLNRVRKCLRKSHPYTVFRTYYLKLKFIDECKTGWLPKNEIYDFCQRNRVFFLPNLIEPLLSVWEAFDGSNVEYETFLRIMNYREPTPGLPKVQDIDKNCLNFRTTYGEMVKPGQEQDNRLRAGLPTARYLDLEYPIAPNGCCKADITVLPEESDALSRISPSIFANFGVTHRDMFAARDQRTVRRVFEASGEKFTDEEFEKVWNEAAKYHSKGIVSFETFRKALSVSNKTNRNHSN